MTLLLASACSEDRQVGLEFAVDDNGEITAFSCVDLDCPQPNPLWVRGHAPGAPTVDLNLVVDFVALGGTPDCRNAQLQDWCRDNDCAPSLAHRSCTPLQVPIGPDLDFEQSVVDALAGLDGTAISADAPDGPHLVRVVATVQSCASALAETAFTDLELVGCVFSCPANLDQQREDLLLDIELGMPCIDAVRWCASRDFRFPGQ